MANTGPSWTDTGSAISLDGGTSYGPIVLGRGNVKRGTIDLRSKFGAYLFLGVGRGGVTALTNGVNVEVRRTLNNGGILFPGAPHFAAITSTATAYAQTLAAAYTANGSTVAMALGGAGTPVADEDICFWGVTSIPADGTALANLEFLRVSKYSSPTLTVDWPFKINKISGEVLTNQANCWSVWCPGGCVYSVVFDYGDDAAGESVAVVCYSQTFDKLTKVS